MTKTVIDDWSTLCESHMNAFMGYTRDSELHAQNIEIVHLALSSELGTRL